jgi:hypothetical protein
MTSFCGVLVELDARDPDALLRRCELEPLRSVAGRRALLVELPFDVRRAMDLADRASAGGSAFAVMAQTSADSYVVVHFVDRAKKHSVAFDRDARQPWTVDGPDEDWERDLVLALPVDDFVDALGDRDDWTDDDLARARQAHADHRLDAMPRHPPLFGRSLWAWLRTFGVDPSAPDARPRQKPGLLGRLLGRA